MPRKRRSVKGRRVLTRWLDLPSEEQWSVILGWSPPRTAEERAVAYWQSWSAFLADYECIRADLLAIDPSGAIPFAEEARQHAAEHGVAALDNWRPRAS